jgi:thioredoxin
MTRPMGSASQVPWGAIAVVLLGIALIAYVHRSPAERMAGKSAIPWRTDFESARLSAQTANKPLFVDASASWCGACQYMEENTWRDPSVAKALGGYVPVSVDIDSQGDIATKYGIHLLPTLMVIDPQTGEVEKRFEGALDARSFEDWLSSPGGG